MLLHPGAAPPKPLHGVVHHINTGSAAPVFARPWWLDPEKHSVTQEEFLALEKAGIVHRSNSPWASPCTSCPKRTAPGTPAATTTASTQSQCPTGTPTQHAVPQ
jgi:hypothetical protein